MCCSCYVCDEREPLAARRGFAIGAGSAVLGCLTLCSYPAIETIESDEVRSTAETIVNVALGIFAAFSFFGTVAYCSFKDCEVDPYEVPRPGPDILGCLINTFGPNPPSNIDRSPLIESEPPSLELKENMRGASMLVVLPPSPKYKRSS